MSKESSSSEVKVRKKTIVSFVSESVPVAILVSKFQWTFNDEQFKITPFKRV
jgi:hypothetical protein